MEARDGEQRHFVLSDDLPKENPWQDDRLGYKPFCERLSKVMLSLSVPNGYVVGLHGEWGSGKTTALNFVHAFLDKHNQECPVDTERLTLVTFRPWIVSGHQDLIAAFFKIMTENLGERRSWLGRQWNRLLRAFQLGGDPLIEAVATVAVTVDPSGGVASKTVGTVAKKSLGAMVDRFLANPSLQTAYEELRNRLAESGKRFLVTIDDLDRLHDEEIRSIMQMVKTVGRLPNVIYILAYDRRIVWNALNGDDDEHIGPRFAEKVVQQEIELPRPSTNSLLSMLDEEIAFLNEHINDSLRWQYIVRDGVRRWVRNPRDLFRLANAVKFSWPALQGEIDPGDLLAMEGIRLFDAEAFEWIRRNRDFLFSEGAFMMSRDETRVAAVNRLKESLPEPKREHVMSLVKVLFPRSIKAFEDNKAMSEEAPAATAARRGVGYAPGYDAYFGLHPSSDAIPKTVIDGIVANMSDASALRNAILPYIEKPSRSGQPAIGQLLEELRYRFYGHGRPQPTQELLAVLFEIGEKVLSSDWTAELFVLSPRAILSFLIADMLEAWGQEHAGKHLLMSFKQCTSAAFCADVFVERARELGKMRDQATRSPTITEQDLQALGEDLLAKIESAASGGTLADAPFYFDIVRAWAYMGKAGEAKAWLSGEIIKSPKSLAKAGMGLVSYSLGSRDRFYTMRSRPDDLYDINVIHEAATKHAGSEELNQDERNLVASLAKGAVELLGYNAAEAAAKDQEAEARGP
ncbi:P-loop NTPase fold protein [Bradyrhizobium sp. Bra64]|uniref:KAP family P-loop NTPase fold protein n=1 Tax=Bradyrhizobium sp. Bra64 TaxID=2926009 RepID=UPI002117EA03|nr:P-loop NTPase fold protein [Bradyrhizobium sp. Bra64]